MDNKVLFTEKQKFQQWWLWIILLGVNGLFLFGVFKQVVGGQAFGDNPMSNSGLLVTTGFVIALTLLFTSFRLETKITQDGIYVRSFPLQISFRHYTWDNISKCFVRKYNAIAEYGGWGIRIGLFGKGKAFNVSGNTGLQLVFSDNKKILIGTKKPDELIQTLEKIGQLKP